MLKYTKKKELFYACVLKKRTKIKPLARLPAFLLSLKKI